MTHNDYHFTGDTSQDILLIYGMPGCGKTSFAHTLLSEYRYIVIDTKHLKDINIASLIDNHIGKKDILTLMSQSEKKKGLLIDNLDSFYKYDKRGFSCIIDICKHPKECKIVYICQGPFNTNRIFSKISVEPIHISYTRKQFHECVRKIVPDKTHNEIIYLSEISNYNFHNVYKNKDDTISIHNPTDTISEIQDSLSVAKDIFRNPHVYTFDILCTIPDIRVIALHLLENIGKYIYQGQQNVGGRFDKELSNIYRYSSIADRIETFMIAKVEWKIRDINTILSIYPMIQYIKHYSLVYYPNIIYNKYISRSMTTTCNQKLLRYNTDITDICRYLYLRYICQKEIILHKTHARLHTDMKQCRIISQLFLYCYHCKISPKTIHKLCTGHLK